MRCGKCISTFTLAAALSCAVAKPAKAESYGAYLIDYWGIRADTFLGAVTAGTEDELIKALKEKYASEAVAANVPFIGQPAIYAVNGVPQVPGFPDVFAEPGDLLSISFGFVDPATELAVTGPAVAMVEYFVNIDPTSATDFIPIGTSSDAGSDFSITYLYDSAFEPEIEAIPFDANGNPIVITGVDGDNDAQGIVGAVDVPEPSAVFLLGTMIVLAFAKAGRSDSRRTQSWRGRGSRGQLT
jgi:hypothetical protein